MENQVRIVGGRTAGGGHYQSQKLRGYHKVFIGIDIGSASSDVVVLDENCNVIISDYQRTQGRPIATVREQLGGIFEQIRSVDVGGTAITGSAGRFLAKLTGIGFVNEVPAQAAAICHLYPQYQQATIIEMGGQDSKLIFISRQNGVGIVRDFALNTVCAAGTGAFLDQQAQRLGVDIENQFGCLALQSSNVPRMAGRCSVFAKSDMIHLQQQATPLCDIIAGLCLALAGNLKSNLGCGREFVRPMIFTGGVAANIGVVRSIEQVFELDAGQLKVPAEHFFTGAIGAVLVSKTKGDPESNGQIHLEKIDQFLERRGFGLKDAPRLQPLSEPKGAGPKSEVFDYLLAQAAEPIEAYLGVDVGSISTNVAVIDNRKRVLAKAYLMTAGRPLEAVREGLEIVGAKTAGKVKILGAATTGSGRYLTGDFIGADVVINEITAQAAGASIVNPGVDTIFEIGGQDSKYISLENGVVVDFEMNHACAAGTGSFLEEQSQRLGININGQFAELALKSRLPIKLGERCTVFMESDLLSYQQQGAGTEELVAGLSYSIVANYLNRVVGRRKIGDNICFQGGTAFNKAVWSAFEKVIGKPIMVPDHHEVTGAIGAAAIAAEHMRKAGKIESSFRGFDNLVSIEYTVESFSCSHCPNHCEIKKVQLPKADPLYYGSRCDRYNLKKKTNKHDDFGAFEYRRRKLLEFAELGTAAENRSQTKIGIPMALINHQFLPLFARFFKSLGFDVVISGMTDKRIVRMGVESVTAQPCFPVKVAYGHIAELIEKQVDYIFIPSIVSMPVDYRQNKHNQLCPYVQSLGYQVKAAFAGKLGRTKIISSVIRMGEGTGLLRKSFVDLAGKLGSGGDVRAAIKQALGAQAKFEQAVKDKGKEILGKLGDGQKLFVLISRPYNGCDDGVNLRVPAKLSELGLDLIPMDMLDLQAAPLTDQALHSKVYWSYGQKILRAAEIIKNDSRLFAIYLSNFGCGPDSFLQTFFRDIMSPKPALQLEIDEHSADAGVLTRLEAFVESLKHYHENKTPIPAVSEKTLSAKAYGCGRKLYIPYMGDCSYGVAACFQAYGQPAEVMPIADESVLLGGRKFTTGKECLPCAITAGDMLKVIKEHSAEEVAFFMPSGCGPCRFGMYNCMHKLILKYAGSADVPIISPNQDGSFYRQFAQSVDGASVTGFMKNMWTASVGIDLLSKLILKLRPFARDRQQMQQVYRRSVRRWAKGAENKLSLSKMHGLMESIAADFSAVKLDRNIMKPKIGVVGEIYVRNHPFANMNIIARLEELGAACELASVAEWIYYTNFTRARLAIRRKQIRALMNNFVQNYFQQKIERRLAEPLEERFGKLAEEPIENVIKLAQPYIHPSFEGEAILSVGKMVEFYHQGIGGVVNVMPFSCMPSTIVSSQTRRISADCGDMPILNLSFDGQADAALTTRLEAFVEQVSRHQKSLVTVSQSQTSTAK